MAARREVGRELDAEQAILLALVTRGRSELDRGLGRRLPDHHAPVALDVEDPPVGRDVELERILGVVVERDLLEVGGARRGHPVRAAAGAGEVGHRPDSAEQVRAEDRVGEGLGRVAAARVPGVAAVELRAPRDRVVVSLAAPVLLVVGRLVERRQHVDVVARAVVVRCCRAGGRRLVVVPLVRPVPAGGNRRGGGMGGVLDIDRAGRGPGWMGREIGARQIAVPVPAVFRVGRGVDPDVAVARRDVALERALLLIGEDVARGGQPDDRLVLSEVRVGEGGRVLGGVDREAVGRADLLDCGDAGRDRIVPERGRLGEHEHPLQRCGGRSACRHQASEEYANRHEYRDPSRHVRFATYQR